MTIRVIQVAKPDVALKLLQPLPPVDPRHLGKLQGVVFVPGQAERPGVNFVPVPGHQLFERVQPAAAGQFDQPGIVRGG